MTGSPGEVNNIVKFGTLEYYKLHADALNKDEVWLKGAMTTTYLIVYTDVLNSDGMQKAFLYKSDNGKVTVSEAKASDINQCEFAQTATYAMHAGIAKGEINVQKAKLKLSMVKIMKNQKTFMRIMETAKALKDIEY